MDREWRNVLIVIGIVAILLLGGFVGVKAYSGLDSPMTVVVSGSMQHGSTSQLGVIDTGDMVIMKNKDKGITTYVDGWERGYSTFGEYGDVIIYNKDSGNPVIHRAICYIEFNNDGTMKASLPASLEGKAWKVNSGESTSSFTGISFYLPVWKDGNATFEWLSVSNGSFENKTSGYLTKGDANKNYDQCSGIWGSLVETSRIKAVAGAELPWIGCVKLYATGQTTYIQKNSPYCLAFLIFDILALLAVITLVWEYLDRRRNGPY